MARHTVSFEIADGIGRITLSREADVEETAAAMVDIRQQSGYGSGVIALAITGGAGAFSIGAGPDADSRYGNRDSWLAKHRIASVVASFDQPVIAAVNGDVFGQGLEIALACDLRIAEVSSRFAMTQIGRGTLPWDGGSQRLSRLVGRGKAMEMILLGQTIDAADALACGLVNRIVPADTVDAAAREMLEQLADKGPVALRYAKEAIYAGMDMPLAQGLRLEADLYFLLHTTSDRSEGIHAFREKRDPVFTGK